MALILYNETMNKLSDVDLGWVAGILEGEGYFGIYTPKGRKMSKVAIVCRMTDRDVIYDLQRLTGVGAIYQEKIKLNAAGKPLKQSWAWEIKRKGEVDQLCKIILPHLRKRRSAKVEEIITFCSTTPLWGHEPSKPDGEFARLCLSTQSRLKESNEKLGARLNVTGATFSRWKNGVVQPPTHKRDEWTKKLESL